VSPHCLVQEWLAPPDYGWKMLVACCLLNRTTGAQARPALAALMKRWPTPRDLARADLRGLSAVLRPLGLWRARGRTLRRLSRLWSEGERDLEKLPGVGPYATCSWAIFVSGALPRRAADGKLEAYLRWRREFEPID
jgi:methyl-CpG-binding domain protein 4